MPAIASLLHVLGAVGWLGGLAYQLLILMPLATDAVSRLPQPVLIRAMRRFRWVALGGMVMMTVSGLQLIAQYGGMKNLTPILHAKVGLGMVLVLLGLITQLICVPKLTGGLSTPPAPSDEQALLRLRRWYQAIQWLSGITLGLTLVIFYLLARARGL
jgi:uncharacterized membrane protein